jgi:G:T-mismatch repair DNA endonuclease (very short patch repair protein)
MNIEYERNGVKKITDERFRKDLEAVGWTVVEVKEVKAKKKAK